MNYEIKLVRYRSQVLNRESNQIFPPPQLHCPLLKNPQCMVSFHFNDHNIQVLFLWLPLCTIQVLQLSPQISANTAFPFIPCLQKYRPFTSLPIPIMNHAFSLSTLTLNWKYLGYILSWMFIIKVFDLHNFILLCRTSML